MKRKKTRTVGRLVLVCIGLGIFIGACNMSKYESVVMTPPLIPGASYVGSETCANCHDAQHKYFNLTDHASITLDITDEEAEAGQVEGCEACHGPGSLHIEGLGDKSKIIKVDSDTCFGCHLDIKGKFMLQHRHPVLEGRMSCTDCHDMHGSDVRATGGAMLSGQDEKCFSCHKEMKGPFVFPHEAMRDGCTACHNPHGSISDKLLVAGPTVTCIRCHIHDKHEGSVKHYTNCIDCHTRVHGSNNAKSSLRY